MQIGSLIKYHRTKLGMTQNWLATGICSIPHLSKIENNSKEANAETIRLLLRKLEIDVQDVENSEKQIITILKQLLQHIHYLEEMQAEQAFEELERFKEIIGFTEYMYLYEIYKLRYFLFTKDLSIASDQIKWLNAQKQNFSQHEKYLLSYFSAIALMLRGKYGEADEKLTQIIQENAGINPFEGDIYYHLAVNKGYLEQTGHAIYYGRKALEFFKNQFNYKRILHVQMSLAINYTQSKIYDEALECYDHLLRNAELLQRHELLPQITHNIGDLRYKMGDYLIALTYFKKSVKTFSNDSTHYLLSLYNIAVTEYRLEKWSDCRDHFHKLQEEANHLKVTHYQLYATYYLLLLDDQKDKAMSFLEEKVVPYTAKMDDLKEAYHTFAHVLSEYYKKEEQYEKAVQYII